MGEQYIDLFAAGAYALVGRLYAALASPSLAWIFLSLASFGILVSMMESAVEERPDFWLRHLVVVCFAAILTLLPQRVDLTEFTYADPGRVEDYFHTRVGAAPHLTYWIERLGASAASGLRALTQSQPVFAVPGVAAQVDEIASDPATLNDPQLKANLEIWRRRILPQILADSPDLAARARDREFSSALFNPVPSAPQFAGAAGARQALTVEAALAGSGADFPSLVRAQAALIKQISDDAGAVPWLIPAAPGSPAQIAFSARIAPSADARTFDTEPAYSDAMQRGDSVAADLQAQLPQANTATEVQSADQLYDLLGKSILYNAGVSIAQDAGARGAIGSLCQRAGNDDCRTALAPLVSAAAKLQVPAADRYNTASWTTIMEQPIASLLLSVTAIILKTLSALVVSVLPFALGIAKTIAILISVVGVWLLLWPGRLRIALTWMLGPISFVSLWSVLFNLWADMEPALGKIASLVEDSAQSSWSARAAMSIAISLGYMGLPSLALGIVYGQSGRALYHASARLETALMMAWHTRGSIISFGRRWLVNSPLARRWNQRAYRTVGLGPLRPTRAQSSYASHRQSANRASTLRSTGKSMGQGAPAESGTSPRADPGMRSSPASHQGELFTKPASKPATPRKRATSTKPTESPEAAQAPTSKGAPQDGPTKR